MKCGTWVFSWEWALARDTKGCCNTCDLLYTHTKFLSHTPIDKSTVEISADCKYMSLAGQNTLAGSCCSLLNTLHSLVNVLQVPLGEAVAMISENPARYPKILLAMDRAFQGMKYCTGLIHPDPTTHTQGKCQHGDAGTGSWCTRPRMLQTLFLSLRVPVGSRNETSVVQYCRHGFLSTPRI